MSSGLPLKADLAQCSRHFVAEIRSGCRVVGLVTLGAIGRISAARDHGAGVSAAALSGLKSDIAPLPKCATSGLMHRSKEQAADHRSFWVDAFLAQGDRTSCINFKARRSERRRLWPRGLRAESPCRIPLRATHFGESELPGILLVAELLVLRTCQRCE